MNIEGKKWVADGFVAEGDIVIFLGKPGRGKSWIVQVIAVSVASGAPCLGRFPVRQSTVIFINEDTPTPTLESRFQRLSVRTGKPYDSLPIVPLSMTGFRLDEKSDMKELVASIVAAGEPVLVVIDCLDAVCPGLNTNRTEVAKQIQSLLREITGAGATLLVVHHLSLKDTDDMEMWESDKDFTRSAMGNTKLVALSDTIFGVWQLSQNPLIFGIKKKERRTVLEVPDRFTVRFEEDADRTWASLTYDEEIGVLPTENAKTVAQLFLLQPGGSFTVKEVYEKSGQIIAMPDLRQAIHELERNGVLQRGRLAHNLYSYRLAPNFDSLKSHYTNALRNYRTKSIHRS